MAYALRFDGVDDTAVLDSQISNPIPVGGKLYYEGIYRNNSKAFQMFFNTYTGSGGGRDFISINNSGQLRVRIDELNKTGSYVLVDDDTFVVEVERDVSNYYFYLNSVLQFTLNKGADLDNMIGFSNDSYEADVDLILCYLTDTDGTTKLHNWSPDDSDRTPSAPDQLVLTETIAGNDATGVNMPTDGSAWIDLGGGSIDSVVDITVIKPVFSISATVPEVVNTATVAIDVTKPVFSVESTNNAPEFNSVVDIEVSKPEFSSTATNSLPQFDSEIAVTIPKPIFASSATVTLPGFNSVVDIAITKPEFSASATITNPEFDGVVDVTIPKPVFSVEASNGVKIYNSVIDFDITKPVFSSVATSTRPDFNAEIDFSVSAPVFSAVAESVSPSNNSVIDVTIQKPIFASVATTTKPEFDATVEIDVTKPVFSVLAINGIITFTFSDETNYNQETLSTNFNQQYLSTNYEA